MLDNRKLAEALLRQAIYDITELGAHVSLTIDDLIRSLNKNGLTKYGNEES